ncbi:hypothetical protein Mapa_012914 [Marchantia paleacea]|nr:hypothetical protein Mapa_012914 [Marchantia paleacea]
MKGVLVSDPPIPRDDSFLRCRRIRHEESWNKASDSLCKSIQIFGQPGPLKEN